MTVATWLQTDKTSQTLSNWLSAVDGDFSVLVRIGVMFAPHAQSSPNMTVRVDAGHVFNGVTLTEVAAQSTGTITAPVSNPRIDRVVIDAITGAVSVITGTPAVSPVAPAITSGKVPIAQVALTSSTTSITNSLITDERDFTTLGNVSAPPPYGVSTNSTNAYSVTTAPSFGSLQTGRLVQVKINATNTGSATLNANATGAVTIKDNLGNNLAANALIANSTYIFIYDGTNFILINSAFIAMLNAAQTFTGGQRTSSTALTSSSNHTAINFALNNDFTATLTENTTLDNPSNIVAGQKGRIAITQGASPYTVAFGSVFKFPNGNVPSVSTGSGALDVLYYDVVDATHVACNLVKGFA